jgi:hypothetical protein
MRGEALLNTIHGDHSGEAIVAALDDVCPDLARMTIEWGFGEIVSRQESISRRVSSSPSRHV